MDAARFGAVAKLNICLYPAIKLTLSRVNLMDPVAPPVQWGIFVFAICRKVRTPLGERHIIHPVEGQHIRPGHPAGRMGSICKRNICLYPAIKLTLSRVNLMDPVAPPVQWGRFVFAICRKVRTPLGETYNSPRRGTTYQTRPPRRPDGVNLCYNGVSRVVPLERQYNKP